MYKHYPSIVFGFHACNQNVAEKLINGPRKFKPSENDYDWLGSGMYFWENSLHRAEHFAKTLIDRGQISEKAAGRELDLQNNDVDGSGDVLKRELDRAIINFVFAIQTVSKGTSGLWKSKLIIRLYK